MDKKEYVVRMIFLGTSIRPLQLESVKEAYENKKATSVYPNHPQIIAMNPCEKNGSLIKEYYFPGALCKIPLDQGSYTIQKNYDRGLDLLLYEIKKFFSMKKFEKLVIEISGHSRGAVSATRLAQAINRIYSRDSRITVKSVFLDPVPGPGHKNVDVDINLRDSKDIIEDARDKNVVIYSNNYSFLYTPQKIKNADIIIVVPFGHEDVFGRFNNLIRSGKTNYTAYEFEQKLYSIDELFGLEKGVYWSDKQFNLTKVTKENIISYLKSSSKKRTKILVDVVIDKLGMNLDAVVNPALTDTNNIYLNEYYKILRGIQKTKNYKTALNFLQKIFKRDSVLANIVTQGEFKTKVLSLKKSFSERDKQQAKNSLDEILGKTNSVREKNLINKLKEKII